VATPRDYSDARRQLRAIAAIDPDRQAKAEAARIALFARLKAASEAVRRGDREALQAIAWERRR
jgi:hypothetical protein